MKEVYNLGIAWEWEHDYDFVNLIAEKCKKLSLSVCFVTPENLSEIFDKVKGGKIEFLFYFDRASDVNENFLNLNLLLESSGVQIINRYEDMLYALDKARMHSKLLGFNLNLPCTFVIPPYDDEPELTINEDLINKVGKPFIIKPSTETGGGLGVRVGYSIQDIAEARKELSHDAYLIQEMIYPVRFSSRKAWFRAFYILSDVLLCWWDNESKIYDVVNAEEMEKLNLHEIDKIMRKIHQACNLDFFSSEIALTDAGGEKKFVVVDYVNEIPDMRLKSKAVDGVPDEVVDKIATKICQFVADLKSG